MFFTLGSVLLMTLRWLHRSLRYGRYAGAIQNAIRHTGVFIEKSVAGADSQSSITNMQLLQSSPSFQGLNKSALLDDGHLKIHPMNSVVGMLL